MRKTLSLFDDTYWLRLPGKTQFGRGHSSDETAS